MSPEVDDRSEVRKAEEPFGAGPRPERPGKAIDYGSPAGADDPGLLFCPVRGMNAGATQRLADRTQRLLHRRLRVGILVFLFMGGQAAVRFLLVDSGVTPIYGSGTLVLALMAAWLWIREAPGAGELRAIEFATFGTVFGTLGAVQFYILDASIARGDVLHLVRHLNRFPGIYALILVAFVILVPGTLRRNVVYSALASATGVGVAEVVAWLNPGATELFTPVDRVEYALFGLIMLGLAGGLATFGARALDRARRSLERADDAGMYRLLGKLGEGGMGEVWEAEHRLLARPAAIKLIRHDLADHVSPAELDIVKERFRREAQATASLQSPHTVQLYDFGITEDGTFFYVMEFLDGLDLEELVERFGALPVRRSVHLLRQAAESLAEAHAHGLVHRDVKPGNIHVGRRAGHHDWVRVLDFGLVKSLRTSRDDETALTRQGVISGTPAYFPPELVRGVEVADARSDIYALSATAYWMITGQLLFEAHGPMGMVAQHVNEPPIPPSRRVEGKLPAALDDLILAGLAKDPADRPQEMTEIVAALDAIDLGPPWQETEAAAWWRLHAPSDGRTGS